jgi:predicted RNA-binding protein with PUA-like domain
MQHWILKTEPSSYSFDDLLRDKRACWDGVRNYQARNNLRLMKIGDLAVIYESVGPKSAVGVARVVKTAYQDPKSKEDWSAVDIAPLKAFTKPVSLAELKSDKVLKNMSLVKQSRLSVCPITAAEFKALAAKGGLAL